MRMSLLPPVVIGLLFLGRNCHTCNDDDYQWICEIEQGPENRTYLLEAKVYRIDRQYQLPRGTHIRGRGPGQTFIYAEGIPSNLSDVKNRTGLLAGNETYIGGFTFRGIEAQRRKGQLGGGAIETPGCADAHCAEPGNTGNGAAVSHVLVENIEIISKDGKPSVQLNFWMPKTRYGVCNNVTVSHINSNGSWADGINVHGAHTNILIQNCNIRNSGDDAFAMWSVDDKLTNVTFRNNIAYNPTFPWNAWKIPPWGANRVNCFTAFGGGGQLTWLNNSCTPARGLRRSSSSSPLPPGIPTQFNDSAMIVFRTTYGGRFARDAVATIRDNSHNKVNAEGDPLREDFPICHWSTRFREAPRLAQPHDEYCSNSVEGAAAMFV